MYIASTANGPQENQAVWQGTENKNAGDKVEMSLCAFGDAAGLGRNRTPILACVWNMRNMNLGLLVKSYPFWLFFLCMPD